MNNEDGVSLIERLIVIVFFVGILYLMFTGTIKIGSDTEDYVDEPATEQVQVFEEDESTCSPIVELDEDIIAI